MLKLKVWLRKLNRWWKESKLDNLLSYTGIDVSPEVDVWGILSKTEEELVLAKLYDDKLFMSLLRKYAEGANKAMIQAVKIKDYDQALRFNGQFFCYNSLILKSRRANLKLKDNDKNSAN